MGTIVQRKRNDGSIGYMAQVRIKRKGKVHTETKTFDRKQAANAWIDRRQTELREPGALDRLHADDPTLGAVIDQYIEESKKELGRTKRQVLRTIKTYDIAAMRCSEIKSADIVSFARSIPASPATVQNYLSHLSAVFKLARPVWSYPLDYQAIKNAFMVSKNLGVIAKGRQRERRPTLHELDRLMDHFGVVKARRPDSIPMQRIIPFAIFSTRRQEEITTIKWKDYEKERVLVRDMKNPGDKLGNDQWCDMPPEAAAFIESMPKVDERIFPFTTDAISAAFTRACQFLDIEDLHFHDLRHEGVSRLFELGWTIARVAAVSGHRSWSSLQRYTHMRHVGDKFQNWKWRAPS